MTNMQYPIVVRALSEDDGGGYLALAPDLKGCMGDGATQEEAIADVRLAINEWCAEAVRLQRRIPEPDFHVERANKERQTIGKFLATQDKAVEIQNQLLSAQRLALDQVQAEMDQMKRLLAQLSHTVAGGEGGFGWSTIPLAALGLSRNDE